MRLVITDYNPAPPGAAVEAVKTLDGRMLRLARWDAPAGVAPAGTVLVCQGRSEFLEKYFETIGELLARGFAVVTFDWRGQGLSERELPDPRKGHIDDFALYERDAAAVFAHMALVGCPQPWWGLAHSMGAAVMLRTAAELGTGVFAKVGTAMRAKASAPSAVVVLSMLSKLAALRPAS